jgi:hypothetical protein
MAVRNLGVSKREPQRPDREGRAAEMRTKWSY